MAELTPFTERVRRLVLDLGSAEAIELILLLRQERQHSFAAKDVGAALRVSRTVEPSLERLASLNLLDVHVRGELRYRYAPGSPELDATVAELERDYASRRLAVLDLLGSTSPARAFADAFRIRRRKEQDG